MNARRSSLMWEVALIAAAIGLQAVHRVTSYDAGFMYVDGVGIPAVCASLLLGMRSGVRVAIGTALAIVLLDSSGVIGALLKLAATMSTIVALRAATWRLTLIVVGVSAFLLLGGTGLTLHVLGDACVYLGFAAVMCPLAAALALAAAAPGPTLAAVPGLRMPYWQLLVPLVCAVALRGTLMIPGDLFFAVPVFFHEPTAEAMRAYAPATVFFWNGVQAVIEATAGWIGARVFEKASRRLV